MKKVIIPSIGTLLALGAPMLAFAQAITNFTSAGNFVITTINDIVVPLLFAVAFLVFIWGAFQTFIVGANSEEVKEHGKNLMLWGLIGFFVMISVWGLVGIFTGSILVTNTPPTTPTAAGI